MVSHIPFIYAFILDVTFMTEMKKMICLVEFVLPEDRRGTLETRASEQPSPVSSNLCL
jgi:hypothetical protein